MPRWVHAPDAESLINQGTHQGCPYGCADISEHYPSAGTAVCTAVRLAAKRLNSGWTAIQKVRSSTNTPGTTNNNVRSNLLNAPARACEMGKRPVLDNFNRDI